MALVTIPLVNFAPDKDPSTEGIITDFLVTGGGAPLAGFIPVSQGFGAMPAPVLLTDVPLAEPAQGGIVAILTGGSTRVIIGAASSLQEVSGTTFVDRSRGGGYTAGTNTWRFAAYGDWIYATDKVDAVQKSTGAAFANISTIPKCSFMDRIGDFLIIAGTNEATYGDQADRYWCSALGNPDDMVPSIATQCVTNRLTDTGGPITASKGLGDDWIIYKQRAIYRGTYQGPPFVWDFQRVSDDIGTISHESVVKVGFSHFFVGNEDFYVFDGAVPRPIPNDLKTWFFNRMDASYAYKTQGFYDRYRSTIFWFYVGPTTVAGEFTDFVAVHLPSGRWGAGNLKIELALEYITGGMTYAEFYPPTGSTTWNALPAISYDSPLFLGGNPVLAVVRSVDSGLSTMNGASSASNPTYISMTLGDIGDDISFSTLKRVIPRCAVAPTSGLGSIYPFSRNILGATLTAGASVNLTSGRFYFMKSARWHRVGFLLNEDPVIAGITYEFEEDGEE